MAKMQLGIKGHDLLSCLCLACCLAVTLQLCQHPVEACQAQLGRSSSGDDAQILRQAQGAFNTNNLLLARQLAERIRDASGSIGDESRNLIKTIDDINSNNTKLTNARISIQRGKFADACALLREIQAAIDANKALKQRYPDLEALKVRSGGCQPTPPLPSQPPDTAKADYEKAVLLKEQGRLREALTIFNRILKSHPGYTDVEGQIREVNQEISDSQKKNQDDRVAELSRAVGQFLDDGDLRAARRELNVAEAVRPGDPGLKRLRQQIETALAKEENQLADGITAYYDGRYEQAQKALEEFLARRHSAPVTALARFYSAAALGSRFFLSGGKDEAMKNTALRMFQQTLKDDPGYSPRWDVVASRIRDLYSEANKKPQ